MKKNGRKSQNMGLAHGSQVMEVGGRYLHEKTFIGLSQGAALTSETTRAAIAAMEKVGLTMVRMDGWSWGRSGYVIEWWATMLASHLSVFK